MEGDYLSSEYQPGTRNFNPRLPCGRRLLGDHRNPFCFNFNPRLPCGRRQRQLIQTVLYQWDFNPRLPCGRRHKLARRLLHQLRSFQSTPSVWKATSFFADLLHVSIISIHAFRVEGDAFKKQLITLYNIFQSTPSVWKATVLDALAAQWQVNFNPRLPCGRRPADILVEKVLRQISIHAFRVEGDSNILLQFFKADSSISIHAFRVEGDCVHTVPRQDF